VARKPFLIRLDPAVLTAIEAWASDDLRSVNAQIEFLLREALRKAGRKVKGGEPAATSEQPTDTASAPAPGGRRRSG
jgi:hypothetical protein